MDATVPSCQSLSLIESDESSGRCIDGLRFIRTIRQHAHNGDYDERPQLVEKKNSGHTQGERL
jgi:hypothetical protein